MSILMETRPSRISSWLSGTFVIDLSLATSSNCFAHKFPEGSLRLHPSKMGFSAENRFIVFDKPLGRFLSGKNAWRAD
jgi:hypothetical protein